MADSESSDVLANLPTGRPARRSSRRGTPGEAPDASGTTKRAPANPAGAKPRAAAKPKTPAESPTAAAKSTAGAAKPSAAATKRTAAAKPKATGAAKSRATAAKPKASTAKSATASKTTAKASTSKPAASKVQAGKTAAKPEATAPRSATPRRPRIATPPEGRRADFSGTPATHRARKVTTNRPWLPSSGYSLPDSKDRAPLGIAIEGLAGAIGDVARVSIGIVQSLSAKRRRDSELTSPDAETEASREPTKS